MIINEVFKRPIISFGLGMTMLSCEVGDDVTVWQNEVYDNNIFILEQDEIPNASMFCRYYYDNINPFNYTNQTIDLTYIGILNQRPSYTCEFNSKTFKIYYNTATNLTSELQGDSYFFVNKWVVLIEGTTNVMAYLINDGFYPLNGNYSWVIQGYDVDKETMLPISITTNVNNQGFTFPAVESKQIQIEITNKHTGHISKSNTIQLIVNSSSS